jgi:thiol-disulfide isomerase/thioredoxin
VENSIPSILSLDPPRRRVWPKRSYFNPLERLRSLLVNYQSIRIGLAALLVAVIGLQRSSRGDELLTIGSDAPPLDIEHWVQDGDGQFEPVTEFEQDKVYVVEFWATWCGPCISSMPHLAELQREYADRGVQIISVSDEDLQTVERFLKRPVQGAADSSAGGEAPGDGAVEGDQQSEPKTYADVTNAYCLTTDPDQSVYEDYMTAAAQGGIPTAFIVGKTSKIEWIGHPMEMDGPLAAVVADSWDRDAFAEEMKAKQEREKVMREIFALVQQEKFDESLEALDEFISSSDESSDPNMSTQLKMLKLQVLILADKQEQATEHASQLFTAFEEDSERVNMLAWNLYEMAADGRLDNDSLIAVATQASEAAVDHASGESKASLLDTLAHLVALGGDLDRAIAIESEALKLAGDRDRAFIEAYLAELKEKKQSESSDED